MQQNASIGFDDASTFRSNEGLVLYKPKHFKDELPPKPKSSHIFEVKNISNNGFFSPSSSLS